MSTGSPNPNISSNSSSLSRVIFGGDYAAADEGSYFTAWLGATAIGTNALTSQALATANPSLTIINTNPTGGSNLYLRSIKLRATAVVTGTTSVYHVGVLRFNPAEITATGTALNGPSNVNSASGTTSRAGVYGGVLTATTQASCPNSRIVHTGPVTSIIPIILDQWFFNFGETSGGNSHGTVIGTTTNFLTIAVTPVVIGPQTSYTFGVWGPSWQAAAMSFTYDVAFIERPSGQ